MPSKEFNLRSPLALYRFFKGMIENPSEAFENALHKEGKDYDSVTVNLGFRKAHFLFDQDLIAEGIRANKIFQKTEGYRRHISFFGETGIFTSNYEDWDKQNNLNARFLARGTLDRYEKIIAAEADELVEKWTSGKCDDLLEDCKDFSIRSFFKAVVKFDVEPYRQQIKENIDTCNSYLKKKATNTLSMIFGGVDDTAFKKSCEFLHGLMDKIFEPFEKEFQADSLPSEILKLNGFYDAKDDDQKHEARMKSYEQMTHLFVAGYETSAASMTWMLFRLANNPDVQDRACKEIADTIGQDGVVDTKSYRKLAYMEQVIMETVRLNPAVYLSIPRKAGEDYTFKSGYKIKKGEYVTVPITAVNTDPRYYEDPQEFRPERQSKEATKDRPKDSHLSFYAGPHGCTGKSLFMLESTILATKVLQKLRLEQQSRVPGVEVNTSAGPEKGYGMTFTQRTSFNFDHVPKEPPAPAATAGVSKCPFHRMMNKLK